MGMTMTQKILAAHAGLDSVETGQLILANLDLVLGNDITSASLDASHVLLAIGVPHEKAHGSLRLSISKDTSDEDIDYIIENVAPIVDKLRNMSPLWEDIVKREAATK